MSSNHSHEKPAQKFHSSSLWDGGFLCKSWWDQSFIALRLLQMHQKVPPFLFPFFALYCIEIQLKKMKKHFQKTCVSFCTLFRSRSITRLMDFVCMDLLWVTTSLEGIKSLRSDLCKSNPNLYDTSTAGLVLEFEAEN